MQIIKKKNCKIHSEKSYPISFFSYLQSVRYGMLTLNNYTCIKHWTKTENCSLNFLWLKTLLLRNNTIHIGWQWNCKMFHYWTLSEILTFAIIIKCCRSLHMAIHVGLLRTDPTWMSLKFKYFKLILKNGFFSLLHKFDLDGALTWNVTSFLISKWN